MPSDLYPYRVSVHVNPLQTFEFCFLILLVVAKICSVCVATHNSLIKIAEQVLLSFASVQETISKKITPADREVR